MSLAAVLSYGLVLINQKIDLFPMAIYPYSKYMDLPLAVEVQRSHLACMVGHSHTLTEVKCEVDKIFFWSLHIEIIGNKFVV